MRLLLRGGSLKDRPESWTLSSLLDVCLLFLPPWSSKSLVVKSSESGLSQPWVLSHGLEPCSLILLPLLWVRVESWGWAPVFMESNRKWVSRLGALWGREEAQLR